MQVLFKSRFLVCEWRRGNDKTSLRQRAIPLRHNEQQRG